MEGIAEAESTERAERAERRETQMEEGRAGVGG